jgi:Ca2+-binding EF-hand superfamily protein
VNNPIEKWLKGRFRDGFTKMKKSFEELDRQRTGKVRKDQFSDVLKVHGLRIEMHLMDAFLERCGVKPKKDESLISYREFLSKFQNRSENGAAFAMITTSNSNDNKDTGFDDYDLDNVSSSNGKNHGPPTSIEKAERRLMILFQRDFLQLLQVFRNLDREHQNKITKKEFQAAIESHFSIEISQDEFDEFLKEIPCDCDGKIKYLDYMTRFDTETKSLFDVQSIK